MKIGPVSLNNLQHPRQSEEAIPEKEQRLGRQQKVQIEICANEHAIKRRGGRQRHINTLIQVATYLAAPPSLLTNFALP